MKKKSWLYIIAIIVLVIVIGYLGVVACFYLFDSNNISAKLKIWGFNSTETIGEMYTSASFDIEIGENHTYGINVDEDGYVVCLYTNLGEYEDEQILVYSTNSSIYNGEVVFADEFYNLAVIKLSSRSASGSTKLSLPYVKIGSLTGTNALTSIISVGSISEDDNYEATYLTGDSYYYYSASYNEVDGQEILSRVYQNTFGYTVGSTSSLGAVLNRKGELLGLHFCDENEDGYCGALSVESLKSILSDIKASESTYTSALVEAFDGVDMLQIAASITLTKIENNVYVYNNTTLSNDVLALSENTNGIYVLSDFVYGDVTIEAGNLISVLKSNTKTTYLTSVYDLIQFFYSCESGDTFSLISYDLNEYDIELDNAVAVETVITVA